MSSDWLSERPVTYIPVTFTLDFPAHGAAVAQRKQLLLVVLLETKETCFTCDDVSKTRRHRLRLTLFRCLTVNRMFGSRESGPREQ